MERQRTKGPSAGPRWRAIIFYLLGVVEALLTLRFFFKLAGGNPASPFVALLYSITEPFVSFFRGAFPNVAEQRYVVEWATVLAMIIYALVTYGIVRLVELAIVPRS